jgi:hypothetical protein
MAFQMANNKIFISYSHKDCKWLERLRVHLRPIEREGKIECWDDKRIQPGEMWKDEIRKAVASSKIAVLLVSADFLASDFIANNELPPLLAAAKAGGSTILPVIIGPCRFEKDINLSKFQAVNPPSQPLINLNEGDQEAVFVKLADTIEAALGTSFSSTKICTLSEKIRNLPLERNCYFTGRKEILLHMYDILTAERKVALSGIGGVGKTHIALEYAYRYEGEYEAIFWIRSDSREAIVASYFDIASMLKLPEKDSHDQDLTIRAVKLWLQKNVPWLLIFDNADEVKLVYDFFPVGTAGHLLITTRTQAIGPIAHPIKVEPMKSEEGAQFLLHRANIISPNSPQSVDLAEYEKKAETLSHQLGGLPLALDQAGSFIEENFSTLDEYFRLYRQEGKKLRDLRGEYPTALKDHPESVAVTLSLAFNKLACTNAKSADLVRLCCFLYPEQIPEEIFNHSTSEFENLSGVTVNNPMGWAKTRQEACRLSLLHAEPHSKTLSIHRLVQDVLKDKMDKPTQRKWAQSAVKAVCQIFPTAEFENWPKCQRLLSHE